MEIKVIQQKFNKPVGSSLGLQPYQFISMTFQLRID